ncbi:hypothetical protein PENARI_c004G10368 [Penicillium arizonense]|uniref:Methyltransferase domain-containing protein n=1 Tax=Penicillium arizonense TaxID=1835702 RepID=A0A1F5LRI2_PENAI|nr:hypothetical protein PENARI_c004G10368 [Penicillium arizonense]OGE55745.1 hypothetical protein PENARI_c004G10368 [Penicillium arizonense]
MAEDMLAVDPDVYVTTTYGDDWQSIPSDEQSFESYEAGHLVDLILESDEENPLFKAPIRYKEAQILDIGTGQGNWAIDVADFLPQSTVRGVDLFPPPVTWVPPNCILEVDNILEQWTWNVPLDLIHMRGMTGSFEPHEWDRVYKQCYDNLKPGGWIEQLEASPYVLCDDDSLPADSILHTWGPNFTHCCIRAGRPIDTIDVMAGTMRKAGFVDFHEKEYKWPIGPWPRDQKYKEAGTAHYQHWLSGMEGWCMWLLTKYGAPNPWSKDEVTVYVAKLRAEIKNPRYHIYQRARRVWARKPFPEELAREASVKEEEETLDIDPLYIKQEPQE